MAPRAKKARGDSVMKFDPEKLVEYMQDAKTVHTDAAWLLEAVCKNLRDHNGIEGFLQSFYTDQNKAADAAEALWQKFVPVSGIPYFTGNFSQPGLKHCHLYMLGFLLLLCMSLPLAQTANSSQGRCRQVTIASLCLYSTHNS